MAQFLRFGEIKKTRKPHVCVACNKPICVGDKAFEWVSIDSGVSSVYLHNECGQDVQDYCFKCQRCENDDAYYGPFMLEALRNGEECMPCQHLRRKWGID